MSKKTFRVGMAGAVLVALLIWWVAISSHGNQVENEAVEKPAIIGTAPPVRNRSAVVPPTSPVALVGSPRMSNPAGTARGPNRPNQSPGIPTVPPLDTMARWRQIYARIEGLIQGQPALEAGEVFKRLQEINRVRDAIQMRSDAVVVSLEENSETNYGGYAYHFPTEGQFYIQYDVSKGGVLPNPDKRHFYGPFVGDPYSVLGVPPADSNDAPLPTNNLAH